MNAGAHAGELAQVLRWAVICGPDGRRRVGPDDLDLGYRRSAVAPGEVVAAAGFALRPGDPAAIAARLAEFRAHRRATQPQGVRTFGSVFTNPEGDSAGRLLEAAGCKGLAVGGARFSPVHANFIEASPGCRAGDVLALMAEGRRRVLAAGGPRAGARGALPGPGARHRPRAPAGRREHARPARAGAARGRAAPRTPRVAAAPPRDRPRRAGRRRRSRGDARDGHGRRRAAASTGSPPGRCWRRPGWRSAATTAPTAPSWSRAMQHGRRRGHDDRRPPRGDVRPRPPTASPGSRRCSVSPRLAARAGGARGRGHARPRSRASATRPCWCSAQGRVLGPRERDRRRRAGCAWRWPRRPAGADIPDGARARRWPLDRRRRPRGGRRGSARCGSTRTARWWGA